MLQYGILVILIVAIAAPLFYSAGSSIKRSMVRREMLEKLERSHLHTISIPIKEVSWYKKDREIIINNKMFDIKSWKVVGNTAIFHGLYDEEETQLNKEAKDYAEKSRDHQSAYQFQKLVSAWIKTERFIITLVPAPKMNLSYKGYIEENLPEIKLAFPSPPPKMF